MERPKCYLLSIANLYRGGKTHVWGQCVVYASGDNLVGQAQYREHVAISLEIVLRRCSLDLLLIAIFKLIGQAHFLRQASNQLDIPRRLLFLKSFLMAVPLSVACVASVGCSSIRGYEAESGNPDLLEKLEEVVKANRSSLKQLQPSLNRHWRRDMAVLPYVQFEGTKARILNVRDCRYRSEKHYQVKHFDRGYDLNELRTVDFIVVPFKEAPSLAHTMLSFGFANQDQVVISVEARLEEGEEYSPTLGAMDQFELMYIVGTEQDLIRLRTDVRKVDVFLYRGNAKPELVKDLFTSMLARVNDLARTPEFYDTLKNNCTTNIVRHVNQLMPGKIPADLRVLFPGYSDKLAYDLDLIEKYGTFDEMRARSKINTLALLFGDSPDFSQKIRLR